MDELTIAHLIMGSSFISVAVLSFVIKPKNPNKFMGYRTKRSMKSIETWKFANDSFGKLMLWNALVAITIQLFTYFTMEGETSILITVVAFTIGVGVCFIIIENQLMQMFKPDGSPKGY